MVVRKILALYPDFDSADGVIEALVDAGVSLQNIMLKSGSYWRDEAISATEPQDFRQADIEGHEVMLKIQAADRLAKTARELICNSSAIDVRERAMEQLETWEMPEAEQLKA